MGDSPAERARAASPSAILPSHREALRLLIQLHFAVSAGSAASLG